VEKHNNDRNFISLDSLLEILGNPTRRALLSKLAKIFLSTSELANVLGISRQAVHSQLKILSNNNIIEEIDPKKPGGKYGIKSNLSIRIDISPDYYNIKYNSSEINDKSSSINLKDIGCSIDFENIKEPEEKIRFLGVEIKKIEKNLNILENDRRSLLKNKECFIIELKNIMEQQYREKLMQFIKERRNKDKLIKESLNLGEDIFFTLFFNPEKYFKRINMDNLLDDLFFSDMDMDLRARNRVSVEPLLKDLSKLMDFFWEDEDDWFFDI